MLGKKKKLPQQNQSIVMDPNRHEVGLYALKDEKEKRKETSDNLDSEQMKKLDEQLAKLNEAKQELQDVKEKIEKEEEDEDYDDADEDYDDADEDEDDEDDEEVQEEEVEKVKEESPTIIVQGTMTEDGNYRYVLESTYPLRLGNCEVKQ